MNKTLRFFLAGGMIAVVIGCQSTAPKPQAQAESEIAVATVPESNEAASLVAVRAESTPDARLILKTAGKPAYTSYNPQPDVFVIDFSRTSKSNGIVVPTNLPEFVASVAVDEAIELGNPLTRVTVRFKRPIPASASSIDNAVVVAFNEPTIAMAEVTPETPRYETIEIESESLPEPVVAAPVAAETSTIAERALVDASVLRNVATSGSGASLVITLEGDGRIDYTAFRLSNPLRVVLDLKGVKSKVARNTIAVSNSSVQRIRVAQFQTQPYPITRVVLDLDEVVDYRVIRKPSGALQLAFGDSAPVVREPEPIQVASASPGPDAPATTESEMPTKRVAVEPNPFEEPAVPNVAPVVPQTVDATLKLASPSRSITPPAMMSIDQELAQTPPPDPRQEQVFTQPQTLSTSPLSSRVISPVDRVYEGEPISLRLKDADLKDVLRTFAQITGLNMAIDPNVSGSVTVEFENVPWDQAFELILRQNNLTFVREGNVIRVGTLDRLSQEAAKQRKLEEEERLNVPLQTVIKPLSYAEAQDVSKLLLAMASPRGKIVIDERTNQLIITEIPQYMTTLLNLIETIDIPTPQVIIEARIVETTKNFTRQLGVQWGFGADLDPALGTGTGLVFPNRVGLTGGPFRFGAGNPVLTLSLGNVLGTFDLDLILTAAEAEGLLRVVSAPKIQTQDNQQAEIRSGVEIPLQTRVNFTTTIQYVDATLRLQVRPHITSDDTVIMRIEVQKVEPALGLVVAGTTNSPLLSRRARTTLMVPNGGTTVIGGIYQSTENRGQTRVPFLHEIPVIGNLFKNRTFDTRHDELLIFITPRIVR